MKTNFYFACHNFVIIINIYVILFIIMKKKCLINFEISLIFIIKVIFNGIFLVTIIDNFPKHLRNNWILNLYFIIMADGYIICQKLKLINYFIKKEQNNNSEFTAESIDSVFNLVIIKKSLKQFMMLL